jgi:hypothetical protein
MWATFDYTKYETRSIVKVMFSDEVNDASFDAFLKEWITLYNAKRDFSFVFDTTRVGYVPLKYSIRMSSFIGKLKKCPYQYLQKSVFIVSSNFVQYMLDFIFLIQPPVAPIYMTQDVDEVESLLSTNNATD